MPDVSDLTPCLAQRQCPVHLAHKPHGWPTVPRVIATHGGPWQCSGKTRNEELAEAMRRKAVKSEAWWHLVTAHGLSHLTESAYGRQTKLWEQVHRALHAVPPLEPDDGDPLPPPRLNTRPKSHPIGPTKFALPGR